MVTAASPPGTPGPSTLDVLSLLAEVADELVVRTVRETHLAWVDRVDGVLRGGATPGGLHRAVAGGVYAGLGTGLRAVRRGLDAVADTRRTTSRPGPLTGPRGRAVHATVNGLIGDRLALERPSWALRTSVRVDGRDVAVDRSSLAHAFPGASGRVAVLVHGWCEDESQWERQSDRLGPGYAATLERLGWTPVLVRLNTGLAVRDNGAALATLMHDLTEAWPVPVTRISFVAHSMGGLVVRAATALDDPAATWTDRVTDVVTLGTPHLGAPLAAGVERGSAGLGRLPETAALGRILDWRSLGVHDLVRGLDDAVPALPHARYRLVSGTLTASPRHPVGRLLGDALVPQRSAYGRSARGEALFAGAEVLHLPRTGHLALLNHPLVHRALADWLG